MSTIGDIDDKTWRKIELLRLALDIVKGDGEFEHISDSEKRLEYVEEFAGKVLSRLEN